MAKRTFTEKSNWDKKMNYKQATVNGHPEIGIEGISFDVGIYNNEFYNKIAIRGLALLPLLLLLENLKVAMEILI